MSQAKVNKNIKSYVSAEDILDTEHANHRIIQMPNVIVGYFADWIETVAMMKAAEAKSSTVSTVSTVSTSLNVRPPIKPN